MKINNTYKWFIPWWQDRFAHHYCCWANNHRGWSKAKKRNRRIAKKRERVFFRKYIYKEYEEKI